MKRADRLPRAQQVGRARVQRCFQISSYLERVSAAGMTLDIITRPPCVWMATCQVAER